MSETEVATLSSVIGAMFGGFISFCVTYYFFVKQRKLEAAATLRKAFVPEIAKCKNDGDHEIKTICFDALTKHEEAIIAYEPYLTKSERDAFRIVWNKYCENHRYRNMNDWLPEPGINNENSFRALSEVEQRRNTLDYFKKLMKFAQIK